MSIEAKSTLSTKIDQYIEERTQIDGIAMLTNSSFEKTEEILEGLIEDLYENLKN